jgi:hypothetical protein
MQDAYQPSFSQNLWMKCTFFDDGAVDLFLMNMMMLCSLCHHVHFRSYKLAKAATSKTHWQHVIYSTH